VRLGEARWAGEGSGGVGRSGAGLARSNTNVGERSNLIGINGIKNEGF